MSLLPQRKKSAEEIAQLRESLGVPPAQAGDAQPPPPADIETIVPAHHQATVVQNPETIPLSPLPAPPSPLGAKQVHSFKRSERSPEPESPPRPQPSEKSKPAPKPVRSLRKSEQAQPSAAAHPEPPPDSPLPHHRHSDREIQEIRRREALALMNAAPNPNLFPARLSIVIPGYVSAATAAAGFLFYDFPMMATALLILVSLGFAAFIFKRKPISRHHAAFIAVISLFVLVFAALHYFPQLRHAT